jgi:hypothetical protein
MLGYNYLSLCNGVCVSVSRLNLFPPESFCKRAIGIVTTMRSWQQLDYESNGTMRKMGS